MAGETGDLSQKIIKIKDPDPIRNKLKSITPLSDPKAGDPQKSIDGKREVAISLPSLEDNIKASGVFITTLRNPKLYKPDQEYPGFKKSNLGLRLIDQSVEKGWLDVMSVVSTAETRCQLPLAIYIGQNHARLLAEGPCNISEGRKIKVYDPMLCGFSEIKVNDNGNVDELHSNNLSFEKRKNNQGDLAALLRSSELAKFSNLLTNIKAFNFQRDYYNCAPYCLFVGAMLNGLEPGNTPFKTSGIKQFEQDFGVRIMTREDILGEKTSSRVKIRPDMRIMPDIKIIK